MKLPLTDPTRAELEAMLSRAAEEGAKPALAEFGLQHADTALDAHDLRCLLDVIRLCATYGPRDHPAAYHNRHSDRANRRDCH